MADKKIIEKQNVKENNPNDDEEVLKNNDGNIQPGITKGDAKEPKKRNENIQDPEITGIS
jgi:hypothetical protein